MYKKSITYTDYNGNERTEVAYFNLSEAELTDWNSSKDGGLSEKLQRIIDSKNGAEIMKIFKQVLKKSYGVKSDDGRQLIKSKKLFKEFSQTEAYNQLFMELCTDAKAAADFINKVIPSNDRMKVYTQRSE
jgi:hypothetical protein